jgi:hypothetical protein
MQRSCFSGVESPSALHTTRAHQLSAFHFSDRSPPPRAFRLSRKCRPSGKGISSSAITMRLRPANLTPRR